jgi:hypothetical protein
MQARPVALAPDHALVIGGGDLAALERQRAIGVEDQLRVVERAAVAFIDAHHQHHGMAARGGAQRLRHRAGNGDGLIIQRRCLAPMR